MLTRLAFVVLALGAFVVALGARVDRVEARYVGEAEIRRAVAHAERLLASGRSRAALRSAQPAFHALAWDEGGRDLDPSWSERMYVVVSTAIVRLGGTRSSIDQRVSDAHAELVRAEADLRALCRPDESLRCARHAEALVALGRLPEAFAILDDLHTHDGLTEPEAEAALAEAALATGHREVADQAKDRCRRLARSRAARVCAPAGR